MKTTSKKQPKASEKPRIGRPTMGECAAKNRTLKVPDEIWRAWQMSAKAAGKTVSEWIRDRLAEVTV